MTKIYYLAHDVARPSGGVAVLYEHVEALRRAGFDACILHNSSGFKPAWLSPSVPIRYVSDGFYPDKSDFVVIPEDFSAAIRNFASLECRRAVFCQNQYYAAIGLQSIGDWRNYGISSVIASTETVRSFLVYANWPDAPLVPYAIDVDKFRPAQKSLQIAYMPRKRGMDAVTIRYLFPHRYPALREVPWVELDGLHKDQVAQALSQTAIFLALGQNESMGLPALEAMASGAMVAGFHGDGDLGLPAARNAGMWATNVDEALAGLETLAVWFAAKAPEGDALRSAAANYVVRYSVSNRDTCLLDYWRKAI